MNAPTKWRDALGREWHADGAFGGHDMIAPVDGGSMGSWRIDTVRRLCGPLVPVEPMARVRAQWAGREVMLLSAYRNKASTFTLALAESYAKAYRDLGYDATVEVVG